MTHPLPEFPPLFPSGEWWRLYVRERLAGKEDAESVRLANSLCGMKAREWMRFRVGGGSMLSLPVTGGASTLKNRPPRCWEFAPQALKEWRKTESTLATLYGKSPYFEEVISLTATGGGFPQGAGPMLEIFHRRVVEFLDVQALLPEIGMQIADKDSRLRQICRETECKADVSLSILDTLFHLGPDAIFTLLPPF